MNKNILKTALKEVTKSKEDYRLCAVIFDKKKIISIGINAKRHHHKLAPKFLKWEGSIHAEQAAILNAKCDLKGTSILVIRINKQGELRLAKPCHHCSDYLAYVGIRRIYYSTNIGEIKI